MELDDYKSRFEKSIEHLQKDLQGLRTGRATPALLDSVMVDAYDSEMDLKSVATISVPDPQTIVVEPWDAGLVKNIEKGIVAANLGVAPIVDGKIVRINLPSLTEENRKDLVKLMKKKIEEVKVRIRSVREDIRNTIIETEKAGEISEDGRFRAQEDLEKMVKSYIDKVDAISGDKEKEIMNI